MTTIDHEANELIKWEDDIYNVIADLSAQLEHYAEGRPLNWDGSTKTQALATIRQARRLLADMRPPANRTR